MVTLEFYYKGSFSKLHSLPTSLVVTVCVCACAYVCMYVCARVCANAHVCVKL